MSFKGNKATLPSKPIASTQTGHCAQVWDASDVCNACVQTVGFPIRQVVEEIAFAEIDQRTIRC